jgi:hypothetical protein
MRQEKFCRWRKEFLPQENFSPTSGEQGKLLEVGQMMETSGPAVLVGVIFPAVLAVVGVVAAVVAYYLHDESQGS